MKLKNYLPKITEEIKEQFIDTDILEIDENKEYQWSQLAVDFACVLSYLPEINTKQR